MSDPITSSRDDAPFNCHLIYFDVTQICGLGCDFCMYREIRNKSARNLLLDDFALRNIQRLINHLQMTKIVISGEGEPFNNEKILKLILSASQGQRHFEINTNGAWAGENLSVVLQELNQMARARDDTYYLRLSLDSYHIPRVDFRIYQNLFSFFIESPHLTPRLHLKIRGLVEDKDFTRGFIKRVLNSLDFEFILEEKSILDDFLKVKNLIIPVNYKNLVHPARMNREDIFKIDDYIKALEEKYHQVFTLGNLQIGGKGLGLNVKSSGEVFFYGAEFEPAGNIFREALSIERILERAKLNLFVHKLHNVPFAQVLARLRCHRPIAQLINQINNPYWVIKEIYQKYPQEVVAVLESF